jgi:hypothetical protein
MQSDILRYVLCKGLRLYWKMVFGLWKYERKFTQFEAVEYQFREKFEISAQPPSHRFKLDELATNLFHPQIMPMV